MKYKEICYCYFNADEPDTGSEKITTHNPRVEVYRARECSFPCPGRANCRVLCDGHMRYPL